MDPLRGLVEASRKATETWLAENDLIGLDENACRSLAVAAGLTLRTIVRDGEHVLQHSDRRTGRISVEVRDGKVLRIDRFT
jgi:hypothetical protein